MKASKKNTSPRYLTAAWWTLVAIAVVIVLIRLSFDSSFDDAATMDDFLVRSGLITLAFLVPIAVLYYRFLWRWHEVIILDPDPILLVMSGLSGIAVWVIAWWTMGGIDDSFLSEAFGSYTPLAMYLPNYQANIWGAFIINEVVILPLLLMVIFWGILRHEMRDVPLWVWLISSSLAFGVFGVLIFGQGILGLLGYGLCGFAAALNSWRTKSAWAGFATHATFMYATHSFLIDLLREVANESYLGITWLTYVLLAGLAFIILMQAIRFRLQAVPPRSVADSRKASKVPMSGLSWLAVIALFLLTVPLLVNELDQRIQSSPSTSPTTLNPPQ